jgi:hypothetical protein
MSDDEDEPQNGETVVSEGSVTEGEKGSQTPEDQSKKPPRKRTSVDKSSRRVSDLF